MAGFSALGNVISSALQSVIDKAAGAAAEKAEEVKQDVREAKDEDKRSQGIPVIKPVVPKLSSIDIEEHDREEEKPSLFEAAGQDVEQVDEVRDDTLNATIDKVGSAASSAADFAGRFLQHPVDTILGMDTPEWEAEQKAKQEQSGGKFRGNLIDDPDRLAYVDDYESLFQQEPEYDPAGRSVARRMQDAYIDDGIDSNYDGLTSDTMTGKRYIEYQEKLGIPGRPIETIDPNGRYSKMEEYRNFGFIPYAKDDDAVRGLSLQNAMTGPTKFFNELAESRTNLNPYTVTVNGKQFDGGMFDEVSNPYLREQRDRISAQDPALFDQNADHTGMTPITSKEYILNLSDGETIKVPGGGFTYITQPQGYYDDNGEIVYTQPSFVVQFKDGQQVEFDSPEDFEATVTESGYKAAEEGDEVAMWVPDLTLEDGTVLNYADVVNVATDERPEDTSDGVSYDFGTLNLGRPQRFNEGIIAGGLENLPANFWDIAASSAPYLKWPVGVFKAGSDALPGLFVTRPLTLKPDGLGSFFVGDPTDDQYWSNILFNAAMPVTEKFAGGIGGKQFFDLAPLITKKFGDRAIEPLLQFGGRQAGEGVEEVIGNIFEEGANSGLAGWYANDLVDENGMKVYDDTGNVVKDVSTSFPERLINYGWDAPDAAVGGVMLGTAMGAPGLLRNDIPEFARRRRENAEAKALGLNPYREAEEADVEFVLPDSLRTMYEGER